MTHLGHHHGCMINYMSISKNSFRIASILIIKFYGGASTKDKKNVNDGNSFYSDKMYFICFFKGIVI